MPNFDGCVCQVCAEHYHSCKHKKSVVPPPRVPEMQKTTTYTTHFIEYLPFRGPRKPIKPKLYDFERGIPFKLKTYHDFIPSPYGTNEANYRPKRDRWPKPYVRLDHDHPDPTSLDWSLKYHTKTCPRDTIIKMPAYESDEAATQFEYRGKIDPVEDPDRPGVVPLNIPCCRTEVNYHPERYQQVEECRPKEVAPYHPHIYGDPNLLQFGKKEAYPGSAPVFHECHAIEQALMYPASRILNPALRNRRHLEDRMVIDPGLVVTSNLPLRVTFDRCSATRYKDII